MDRRTAFRSMALSSLAFTMPDISLLKASTRFEALLPKKGSFSMDGNRIRFTHPDIAQPFSVTMIADTHLFRDDTRGSAYTAYSQRMAKAYNQTKHFQTGKEINPEIAFEAILQIAQQQQSSLIALIGDIFSYPSEAAIEWVQEKLQQYPLPYIYTAGNHDWHYEGMKGTAHELRDTWIDKRLKPLYQGKNPLMQKFTLNGVHFIVLDNSTYEIEEVQLQFLKDVLSEGKPSVLMLHIPLYAPGRSLGFGCGHPQWNAKNDKNYSLERRLPWRAEGHTRTTLEFYETVFHADNLLGVLAGHIHDQSIDVINGIPQIVAEANAEGGYLQVSFTP